jgi:hypothetical protein
MFLLYYLGPRVCCCIDSNKGVLIFEQIPLPRFQSRPTCIIKGISHYRYQYNTISLLSSRFRSGGRLYLQLVGHYFWVAAVAPLFVPLEWLVDGSFCFGSPLSASLPVDSFPISCGVRFSAPSIIGSSSSSVILPSLSAAVFSLSNRVSLPRLWQYQKKNKRTARRISVDHTGKGRTHQIRPDSVEHSYP